MWLIASFQKNWSMNRRSLSPWLKTLSHTIHTHTNISKEPYVCAWSTPRKKEKTNSGFWHFCALTMLGISLSQLQLGKIENPLGVTVGSVYWWEEGCKSCNHVWKIQYWLPSQLLQGKDLCKMLKYLLFEVMKYL